MFNFSRLIPYTHIPFSYPNPAGRLLREKDGTLFFPCRRTGHSSFLAKYRNTFWFDPYDITLVIEVQTVDA